MSSELLVVGCSESREMRPGSERAVRRAVELLGLHGPPEVFSTPYLAIAVATRFGHGGLRFIPRTLGSDRGFAGSLKPQAVLRESENRVGGDEAVRPQHLGADDALLAFEAEEEGRSFTVENDGVGFIPFYFAQLKNCDFVGSTALHALVALGLPPVFNMQGAYEYLAFLHPLGDRTVLSGALCLPPASRVTWNPRTGIEVRRLGPPLYEIKAIEPGRTRGAPEYVEAFGDMWRHVMRRLGQQMGDTGAVSLSGGLDSRAIVHGLVDSGFRPKTFTNGESILREVQIAREVALRLGTPHQIVELDSSEYLANAHETARALDGIHSPLEMYLAWHAGSLSRIARTIVQGTSGDVFWGSPRYAESGISDIGRLKDAVLGDSRKTRESVASFLDQDAVEDFESMVRQGVGETIDAHSHLDPVGAAVAWNIHNRQRRWGFAVNSVLWRQGFDLLNPYFFRDFLRFSQNIPSELREGGRLHFEIHNEVFAKTKNILYLKQLVAPRHLTSGIFGYRGSNLGELLSKRFSLFVQIFRQSPSEAFFHLYENFLLSLVYLNKKKNLNFRLPEKCSAYESVYRHSDWVKHQTIYRNNFLDILEEALPNFPSWIDRRKVEVFRDAVNSATAIVDPRVVGRIATLGIWRGIWSRMARHNGMNFDG